MFFYRAYGCVFSSELPLPELVAIDPQERADVIVRLGILVSPPLQETESRCLCHVTPQEAYLFWAEAGLFLIRNGQEIVLDLLPQADERIVRLFLLGAGLGMLLHQRRLMTLHASTVVLNGEALVFVGDRGMGKSTTAAALEKRGHTVLSDDVAAVDCTTHSPQIIPGYPQLKLWADAATRLGHDPNQLPRLHPNFEKHAKRFETRFSLDPVPLKGIYVLGFADTLDLIPLPAPRALATVMHNWYCARFGAQMLRMVGTATHFQRCAALVRRVPTYLLQRPADLSQLEAVASCVEQHFLGTRTLPLTTSV